MIDKENVYDEQIMPLVMQIIGICKAHDIPLAMTLQLSDGDNSLYCSTVISADWASDWIWRAQNYICKAVKEDVA